jgi:hypothetical protein
MLANPTSSLAQYLGFYRMKVPMGKTIYFILMKNVLGDVHNHLIKVYDVKGSTFGRRSQNSESVGKDANFVQDGCGVYCNKIPLPYRTY